MIEFKAYDVNGDRITLRETCNLNTPEELSRMLEAYGIALRYRTQGYCQGWGVRCEWTEVAEVAEVAPVETIAGEPVRTRRHTYCAGTGNITLASGAPATCMGCAGTGRIPAYSKAQRTELERTARRHMNALARIKAYAATLAARVDNVEYMVSSGLDHLGTREPHRMVRLYDSIESGRVADVVRALYDYRTQLPV